MLAKSARTAQAVQIKLLVVLTGLLVCGGPACRSHSKPPTSTAAEQRYKLKGKVVSIDKEQRQVTVDHEAIEGYMGAMMMPFPLKDERARETLTAGDQVQATLVVKGDQWWLEEVVVAAPAAKDASQ